MRLTALIVLAMLATPALAQPQPPTEPWVIDRVTHLAVPQSIERLAALNSLTAGNGWFAAWTKTITDYQTARAGQPVTYLDKAKAFQACEVALGFMADDTNPAMRQCLAGSGYYNFR